MSQTIEVVAAVVEQGGRYLLGRRATGKRHAGQWEFPGGKIQTGETARDALARELEEELGISLTSAGAPLFRAEDPGSPFVISFLPVEVEGRPHPLVHEELAWFGPDDLEALPLAPADYRFVQSLLRPSVTLDVPEAPH